MRVGHVVHDQGVSIPALSRERALHSNKRVISVPVSIPALSRERALRPPLRARISRSKFQSPPSLARGRYVTAFTTLTVTGLFQSPPSLARGRYRLVCGGDSRHAGFNPRPLSREGATTKKGARKYLIDVSIPALSRERALQSHKWPHGLAGDVSIPALSRERALPEQIFKARRLYNVSIPALSRERALLSS